MIAQAHFERLNRSQNVYRFYSFFATESPDRAFQIEVRWGRVGRRGSRRVLQAQSRDDLLRLLVELAQKRHLAGYLLRTYEGPAPLRLEIEEHLNELGLLSGRGSTTAALFYDLPRLAALLDGRSSGVRTNIAELRDLLDPGRKGLSKESEQLVLPGFDDELSTRCHVRALAAELISRLLIDDPLARMAHARALALPSDIEGDNVLYFPLPGGLSSMPVYRLVQTEPALAKLIYSLTAQGVSRVGDLITIPFETLRSRYCATNDELGKLRTVLNGLGLRVGGQKAAMPRSRRLSAAG